MKLSELIRATLAVIPSIDPKDFMPHWETWLDRPNPNFACIGCLAGAYVYAKKWAKPGEPLFNNTTLSQEQQNIVDALDEIRDGDYDRAYKLIHGKYPDTILNCCITEPEWGKFDGWNEFENHLEELVNIATELETAGH